MLFPTCGGEVYGASVNGFKSLSKRINLVKDLLRILIHPRLFPYFYEFAEKTPHTGLEMIMNNILKQKQDRKHRFYEQAFPVIEHHQHTYEDWSKHRIVSPSGCIFQQDIVTLFI